MGIGGTSNNNTGLLIQYVLDDSDLLCTEDSGIVWDSIQAHLLGKGEDCFEEPDQLNAGRLGPPDVVPDRDSASGQFAYYGPEGEQDQVVLDQVGARIACAISSRLSVSCLCCSLMLAGMTLESITNFSSFRANACVYTGKWMYEVVRHAYIHTKLR